MIFGLTGTRKGMTDIQKTMVRTAFKLWNVDEFHHGDCIGSDAEAGDIATISGIRIIIHPPTDPKYRAFCKGDVILPEKPYLERDADIVKQSAFMLATPKGFKEELRSGTWATIRNAKKVGRRLTIIYPNGKLEHINNENLLF